MDCLRLCADAPGGYVEQNIYCNGWKHDHFVASIFVFVIDGTVVFEFTNSTGSQHKNDSRSNEMVMFPSVIVIILFYISTWSISTQPKARRPPTTGASPSTLPCMPRFDLLMAFQSYYLHQQITI